MTYFLIFLAVALAAVVALYVVGLTKPGPAVAVYEDAMAGPVENLPPVLLPDNPVPTDVDRLRFGLGLRGYRMDQVDEVLDSLRDELAAKNVRIAELESLTAGQFVELPLDAGPAPAAVEPQPRMSVTREQ